MSNSEIRNRIKEAAKVNFFNNGFNKITMEEFAHSMGMSKKTIYKFFHSKEELVRDITHEKLKSITSFTDMWRNDTSKDFLTRIKRITNYFSAQMQSMKPQFYIDIQRTMPDLWKEIDDFRKEKVDVDFRKMINEGVELGVFRNDVNIDVLILMYESAMIRIINPETLSTLPLDALQAYDAIVDIIFAGFFTKEAKEKYQDLPNFSTVKQDEQHS